MNTWPSVSLAAAAAGLPSRYVYWHGRSGRRYLFTAADRAGIGDFDEGVAILVYAGVILWAGEVGAVARTADLARLPGAGSYVHLLATNQKERSAVIEDLRPDQEAEHRRAA